MIQVVEAALCSKSGTPDGGDDLSVVTPHFAAVLDGASDSSGATYDGVGAARFVVQAGARAVWALPETVTAQEAVTQLTAAVRSALQGAVPSHAPTRPPCFVFALYSPFQREIWRVGDAQYLIDGHGHNPEMAVDSVVVQVRRMVTQAHLLAGATTETLRRDDPGHKAVKPLLELQTRFMNHPNSAYAYGAVSGEPVPTNLIEVIKVPEEAVSVVLASDGYPRVRATLTESEAQLEHVLEHDPLLSELHVAAKGWRPGAASFDDRAYLRLDVRQVAASQVEA